MIHEQSCSYFCKLVKIADVDRLSVSAEDGIKSFVIKADLYRCEECGRQWFAFATEAVPVGIEFKVKVENDNST